VGCNSLRIGVRRGRTSKKKKVRGDGWELDSRDEHFPLGLTLGIKSRRHSFKKKNNIPVKITVLLVGHFKSLLQVRAAEGSIQADVQDIWEDPCGRERAGSSRRLFRRGGGGGKKEKKTYFGRESPCR